MKMRWLASCAVMLAASGVTTAWAGEKPKIEDVTKDMRKESGLLTIYRNDPNDVEKDATQLLALIPRELLGKDLLLATSISRGPLMGFPNGTFLVRFRQQGNTMVLEAPDDRFVNTPGKPVSDAVGRTFTPQTLARLPILTTDPQGNFLIDFDELLTAKDVADLPVTAGRTSIERLEKVKVFPDNLLVDLDLSTAGEAIGIGYSFRRLPEKSGYKSRASDERIGYFTTLRQDWNAAYSDRENVLRFVERWDLKKQDPSLDVSPPEEPIVFVIEKSVPLQWRRYVQAGIEEWNKAFLEIGISNAIIVQQQTDSNEFADVDPEDARYNFIRWGLGGYFLGMGPSRADPRTGQILDADIIIDDGVIRWAVQTNDIFGPSAMAGLYGPDVLSFFRQNPQFLPPGQTMVDVDQRIAQLRELGVREELLMADPHEWRANGRNSPRAALGFGPESCSFAEGMQQQMSLVNAVNIAGVTGKPIPERLVGGMIKNVVTHEVGHTLGLSHNFKGSSWLSIDEIKRRRNTDDEPTDGSVMDYDTSLIFPGDKLEEVKNITSPVIGPYDFWAIEYGYGSPKDKKEEQWLAEVASRGNEPGLAFADDYDVRGLTSLDPTANRWDMSNDPLAWSKQRIELVDELLKNVGEWGTKDGEPSFWLRGTVGRLMYERARNLGYVARIVGGQELNRNRPGDKDYQTPLKLVSPKQQREALKFLKETVFADGFFNADAKLLNTLAATRQIGFDFGSYTSPDSRVDFPIHNQVAAYQSVVLTPLIAPQTLQRIYDAELKWEGDDRFTAAELVSEVRSIVWGDLKPADAKPSDAKPMIDSYRRNLQQQWLSGMMALAESQPGQFMSADLRSLVRYSLRDLADQIDTMLDKSGNKIDLASKAHLSETSLQIRRKLELPVYAEK